MTMLYVDFSTGIKDYKLRLNTRNTVVLEKQLGCNPIAIFGDGNTLPSVTTMVTILHASLQPYHHGISLNDAYDIFDAYLDNGNTITDFISVIVEIYKVSGLIAKDSGEEGKN